MPGAVARVERQPDPRRPGRRPRRSRRRARLPARVRPQHHEPEPVERRLGVLGGSAPAPSAVGPSLADDAERADPDLADLGLVPGDVPGEEGVEDDRARTRACSSAQVGRPRRRRSRAALARVVAGRACVLLRRRAPRRRRPSRPRARGTGLERSTSSKGLLRTAPTSADGEDARRRRCQRRGRRPRSSRRRTPRPRPPPSPSPRAARRRTAAAGTCSIAPRQSSGRARRRRARSRSPRRGRTGPVARWSRAARSRCSARQ